MKKRILLADDEVFILEVTKRRLEHEGYEVVKKLKENPSTARIPVILFTAFSARWEALLVKCAELGIADCLKKPFESKELVAKIRLALEEK